MEMKANNEAWQQGELDGWNDGYYNRPYKQSHSCPDNWTVGEKASYEIGYKEGYDQGAYGTENTRLP